MLKPRISIIIVSYKVRDLLLNCLRSLVKTSGGKEDLEIIVIDNNSGDGTREAILNEFPNVQFVENNYNAGFSGANNQGIKLAKGDYIFLLNPDTELVGDAVHELKQYLDLHPECVLVAPQLLNTDGSLQISAWKDHNVSSLIMETLFLHKYFNTIQYPDSFFNKTFEPKTLSGAALFFRKSLTEAIGLLDEQLFWMEDIDFCVRARLKGLLVYFPGAKVIHHSGQSQKKNYNVAISNQLLSKLKYFRKHEKITIRVLANLSCFVFICTRILAFSMLTPFGKLYRLKAKAYFYTLGRFLKYIFMNDLGVL